MISPDTFVSGEHYRSEISLNMNCIYIYIYRERGGIIDERNNTWNFVVYVRIYKSYCYILVSSFMKYLFIS